MNTQLQQDETIIRELFDKLVVAFNQRDLEKLLSFHAEDIILMEPNMPIIHGKQQVRELFSAFEQRGIEMQLSFNIFELEVHDKMAYARGQVMKTVSKNGREIEKDTGKFVSLLKKQADGNWLRTHVIVNSDEPAITHLSDTMFINASAPAIINTWVHE